MFKTVLKKIGILALVYVLMTFSASLVIMLPLMTKGGNFTGPVQAIYVGLVLISLVIYVAIAYAFKLISLKEIRWGRWIGLAVINVIIMYGGNILGVFVGQLTHDSTMANQESLNSIFKDVPFYIQLLLVGIAVPIMEEITYRGLLGKVLFGKYVKTGLVVSSVIFVLMHNAFTPQTLVIYGIMTACLAITYYRTKHIEYSMGIHMLNNTLSIVLNLFR